MLRQFCKKTSTNSIAFADIPHLINVRCYSATERKRRPRPLLRRYKSVPIELFRINATAKVILRDFKAQNAKGVASYDLTIQDDGLVHPKPGTQFEGPNGASVRPNGPTLQEIVRGFRGRDTTIYRIPKGTVLPDDLVLLHEHTDHFSIQCDEPMKLKLLNEKVTAFCQQGESMTKEEFVQRYPFESGM